MGLIDKTYWWHNLNCAVPDLEHYHYPFKKEKGIANEYFRNLASPWIGKRCLELGCGTGWLSDAWNIADYTGVDMNPLSAPFQETPQKLRENRNVIVAPISAIRGMGLAPFDTIICYETFHAFPLDAIELFTGPALAANGTVIIVDGFNWWPKEIDFSKTELTTCFREVVDTSWFDFTQIWLACVDAVEWLEGQGVPRKDVLSIAAGKLPNQLTKGLLLGRSCEELRRWAVEAHAIPNVFEYGVVVLRKDR